MTQRSPFRYFKTSPEIIRVAAKISFRYSMLPRNVEEHLHERGIDICRQTVWFRWHRFGRKPPKSAAGVCQNSAFI